MFRYSVDAGCIVYLFMYLPCFFQYWCVFGYASPTRDPVTVSSYGPPSKFNAPCCTFLCSTTSFDLLSLCPPVPPHCVRSFRAMATCPLVLSGSTIPLYFRTVIFSLFFLFLNRSHYFGTIGSLQILTSFFWFPAAPSPWRRLFRPPYPLNLVF